MAQCKLCQKAGLFVAVNKNGLCPQCALIIDTETKQRIRVINESAELVKNSKNLETRLSRLDVMIEHGNALKRYEELGIPITNPPISKLISKYMEIHDPLIIETLEEEYNGILIALNAPAMTPKMKVGKLSKILTKAKEYQLKLNDSKNLDPFIERLEDDIHQIQLDTYVGEAEKAEFKGSKKKALDKYLEALYFLKTDDIDDSFQKDQIEKIESKISELKKE